MSCCGFFFVDTEPKSLWLASSAGKRWGELFFLLYSPFWIIALLGVVVPLKLYEVQITSYSVFTSCFSLYVLSAFHCLG